MEEDDATAIFEFGSGVDGAEGKLGPAVIADPGIGRLAEIEVVAAPQMTGPVMASPRSACAPRQVVGRRGEGEGPVDLEPAP